MQVQEAAEKPRRQRARSATVSIPAVGSNPAQDRLVTSLRLCPTTPWAVCLARNDRFSGRALRL